MHDFDEIWYMVSWINLLQNDANVFHLTWIMSLHYVVKLKTFIAHVLPLSCYRKKLQNLSQLWPPNSPQLNPIDYSMWEYCKACVQNMHHWSGRIETVTENRTGAAGSRHHCSSHLSVASSVGPDQWCVFCTPSFAVLRTSYNHMNSNLANLDATVKVGQFLEFLSLMSQWYHVHDKHFKFHEVL